MTETWFTADTHFTHERIIELCARPFTDATKMNEALVENWNRVVKPDDQVWHLGDVGMGALPRFLPWVSRLNGHKHLIAGNHDEVWAGQRDAHKHQRAWLEVFDTVQPFARRKLGGQRVMLSHFPYRNSGDHTKVERYSDYRFPDTGAWLIHGHVHTLWQVKGRQINVGVDAGWGYAPISIDTIADLITQDRSRL